MKIAYLINAFNNYEHLNRLLSALDDKGVRFFIHIDKKSKMPENIACPEKVVFVNRVKVWWGGWSLQEAINIMMKEAFQHEADYFVLLSGTDYPIRPNQHLYNILKEGGEYINIIKGFHPDKPESRIRYYHFDGFNRRNKKSFKTLFFLALEELQRRTNVVAKRNYPFGQICHGSTWWALSRDCVGYVLDYMENNPGCVRFYKTSLLPDESLIHTIIGNSKHYRNCRGNLTYTDWSAKRPSPAIITDSHVGLFKKHPAFSGARGPFFARKFHDAGGDVIGRIENEMRGRS